MLCNPIHPANISCMLIMLIMLMMTVGFLRQFILGLAFKFTTT